MVAASAWIVAASAAWPVHSGDHRSGDFERGLGDLRLGFGGNPAQVERQRLGLADQPGEVAVARRLARLFLQVLKLAFDFADHIVEPRHVGFGAAQAEFGFVAALVQACDAGGFFQDRAAGERLLADEQADLALAHEGGGSGAGRGVGEENLHVALAHVAAVDAVDAA